MEYIKNKRIPIGIQIIYFIETAALFALSEKLNLP
jgi:hypothetical protein